MNKKWLLIFILVSLVALVYWSVYVQRYAPRSHIVIITHYHLDKIMHALGGAVIAASLALIMGPRRFISLILAVLVISFFWEAAEFSFDKLTQEFYRKSTQLWIKDTVGDALFAVIGALVATRFIKK